MTSQKEKKEIFGAARFTGVFGVLRPIKIIGCGLRKGANIVLTPSLILIVININIKFTILYLDN